MMKTGFTAWKYDAGISTPKTVRFVCSLAKRLSVPPDCSNPIQKRIEKRLMIMITPIRCQSTAVKGSSAAASASAPSHR